MKRPAAPVFVPNPDHVPQHVRDEVAAAVAADPGHTVSLLDINWDGIKRGHDWLIYEKEAEINVLAVSSARHEWAEYWLRNPNGNLDDALKRSVAGALLQMKVSP